MFDLPVGGIKGELAIDIELNFITSLGFIWKGSRLTNYIGHLQKFYRQYSNCAKMKVFALPTAKLQIF